MLFHSRRPFAMKGPMLKLYHAPMTRSLSVVRLLEEFALKVTLPPAMPA